MIKNENKDKELKAEFNDLKEMMKQLEDMQNAMIAKENETKKQLEDMQNTMIAKENETKKQLEDIIQNAMIAAIQKVQQPQVVQDDNQIDTTAQN